MGNPTVVYRKACPQIGELMVPLKGVFVMDPCSTLTTNLLYLDDTASGNTPKAVKVQAVLVRKMEHKSLALYFRNLLTLFGASDANLNLDLRSFIFLLRRVSKGNQ